MAEKDKDNLMIPDEITDDLSIDTTDIFDDSATFKIDKGLGIAAGTKSGKPIDNKAIDDYLSKIEKPTGKSVYDKMAARYRSQGEGAVLRTQKNLANLFSPTINLIQEREAAAQARFTLLKDKMPEFDDSTIFGAQSGNEMPIVDEIKGVSASVKEDLRMLSRLNPADERYDEIKKRVQKNQDSIVNFDKINKQLLKMRNAGTDESQWSKGMDETTANMWRDIYTSNGKNIKVVDGKLIWTDTKGTKSKEILNKSEALNNIESTTVDPKSMSEKQIEKVQKNLIELGFELPNFGADGKWGDETQAAYDDYLKDKESIKFQIESAETTGVGETKTINLNEIGDGPINIDSKATNMDRVIQGEVQKFIEMNGKVDDPMYSTMIKSKLFELNKIGPQGVKSLIFDGIGTDDDDLFTGMNTDSFIEGVIRNHYGEDLSESEIERHIDMMRSGDVTQMYKDESGKQTTLQSQFMKWYKGEIDKKITEGRKSKVVAAAGGTTVTSSGDPTDGTTTPISSWVDFKQSFTGHDFSIDEKFMLPTGNFKGEVIDAYLTINKDGTYNLEMGEDDNRNQDNLNIKDLATRLQKDLYPNTTIKAIENMLKAQSESQGDYTKESFKSKEQSFADQVAELEAPHIERMSQGADVNWIAKNIWEPNTPSGYNMGQNGKALFDYLAENGYGSRNQSLYDLGGTNWGGKDFIEFPKAGTKGMTMTYDGEYVYIYERNMNGYSGTPKKWGGDSTGGISKDKKDIREILDELGISR
tara:strand:- start:2607 stop:4877 length:2271 start_codon:yes stop_codon:yes gene_type:complete